MKKLLTFIPLIAMLTFAISAFAQQNSPLPPQHLRAFVEFNKDAYSNTVKLVWERNPNGVAPQVFVIYSEYYTLNGVVSKKIIDYVPVDTVGNRKEYSYIIKHLPSGVYVFYVTAAIYSDNRSIVESEPSNKVEIKLQWQNDEDIIIYSQPPKMAFVGYTYHYQILAKTMRDCVIDSYELLSAPEGMTISNKGLVEWTPTDVGEFHVKIKVSSTGCPDLKPAIQEYGIKVYRDTTHSKAYIRIISQPPTIAVVGKTWVYRIVAESNIRCPIAFELLHNLDNVEFKEDEATIYWTPSQPGVYYFAIKAYLTCDSTVVTYQKFAVTVKQHDDHPTCAVIQGTATYEDGSLVPNGVVIAWRLNNQNVPDRMNKVFKTYIHQGQFEFYLPEGIYILEFDGETFEHKFYKNANTIAEATRIEVECNDSTKKYINITMILTKKPEPVYYNVSGKVVSAEDNSPVMAIVEFIPVELLHYNEHREKYPNYHNFVTKTDENGDYTIKLPNIFTYKAHAIPVDKKDYMDQYYDQVNSPFEADIIELTSDIDNINFFLKSPPNHQNGFTGIVIDENRNPIKSRVFAYLVNSLSMRPDVQHYVRMVETNEQGQFMFKNLIPGEYVLFSIPMLRTYVPGYYKQNDFATLKWREATRIAVDDIMLQMIFEIKHRTRVGLRGLIRVDGRVIEDRGYVKVGNEPQGENLVGISDAYVYVLDENGNLSDYFVTDFDGRFSLTEVPEGTTTLYISKPGYAEAQVELIGDYEKNFAFNYEIPISRIILKVDETNGLPFTITSNGDGIHIELNANNGIINFVQVYDAMGRIMYESKGNGSNAVALTTSNLNSGVYFVRVGSSLGIHSIKFVVFR